MMYSSLNLTPHSSFKSRNSSILSPFSPAVKHFTSPSVARDSSLVYFTQGSSLFYSPQLDDKNAQLLESYGSQLPVHVTEAITLAERSSELSVKIESFGYASLVCGRQLLVWKYKQEPGDRSVIQCVDLPLPPSDLSHKADLVQLFRGEGGRPPSAIAVSPGGHVRYWASTNHPASSVDTQPDLQGQECASVTLLDDSSCILATTTSSLVLITIVEGQTTVTCRPLTLPVGMLAGIHRKVSSFIFGVVPQQTSETKQLSRVLAHTMEGNNHFLFVLMNSTLQKWSISKLKDGMDQLLFETEMDKSLKQAYLDALYKSDPGAASGLQTWCLDIQICTSGILVLTAGFSLSGSDRNIHYAFGIVDTSSSTPPTGLSEFHALPYSEPYQEQSEEDVLSFKLILSSPDSRYAHIYNSERILCVEVGQDADYDEVNLQNTGNIIVGSGTCNGTALFFTYVYGIVTFQSNQRGDSRILASMKDVSIRPSDPRESADSMSAKLRTAMCAYCAEDIDKCEKIITEITSKCASQDNFELNEAVVALSLEIIDDYPASDPRWSEKVPSGSVSSSLIIKYQLDDKLKAHEYLITFLKSFHLFEKLTMTKIENIIIPTNLLLCEHAEKLVAAKTSHAFIAEHRDVIETTVCMALDQRDVQVKSSLSPQDVFFREVSAVHTLFASLLEWEEEQVNADEEMNKTLNVIMTVNKIFIDLANSIKNYRLSKRELYGLTEQSSKVEFYPWTTRGNLGLRHHLKNQLALNVKHALSLTENVQIQGTLFHQYCELLTAFLEGYREQLNFLGKQLPLRKEFETERNTFLKELVLIKQYERAAAIGESFLDFDILVQICEATENVDRLQLYMHQFAEQKFSEYVFKWYMDKGKKGKIFESARGQEEALGKFLQKHDSLRWMHQIKEGQYELARETLYKLALKEKKFLSRKKTLLSLSKLCALLSRIEPDTKAHNIEAINRQQILINIQESLPASVIESSGIDPRTMRVFKPEELIEMYIAEENGTATAYDFKIALELLSFMRKPLSDAEVSNLRIRIWSKCIFRHAWESMDIGNPLESLKETLFFQLVEMAFDQGIDVHEFLPPMDELLQSPELHELSENTSFKFLLQSAYEHILKIVD